MKHTHNTHTIHTQYTHVYTYIQAYIQAYINMKITRYINPSYLTLMDTLIVYTDLPLSLQFHRRTFYNQKLIIIIKDLDRSKSNKSFSCASNETRLIKTALLIM